jgi:hypothetical protein
MPSELDQRVADRQLAGLGTALLGQADALAAGMASRIRAEVPFYGAAPSVVPAAELHASCRAHLDFVLGSLGATEPGDTSPAEATGRRRADQDVPLPALMDAYRVGSRFIWESCVDQAARTGAPDSAALVRASSRMWLVQDRFTQAMTAGYRDALAERMLSHEHERSALVEALLEGRITQTRTLWETAEILKLPRRGPYVVVAAEVPEVGREAVAGAEARLRAEGLSSAWRLLPDLQVGIVVLTGPAQLGHLVAALARRVPRRAGISPTYAELDRTGEALAFARIALAATPAGRPGVTVFDQAPLAVTAAAAPEVMARVVGAILGPLRALPAAEQEVLLDTLAAWRDAGGSAAVAAQRLFCHPNTVRHRLRRITEATGRTITAPQDVAELCLALEAARQEGAT